MKDFFTTGMPEFRRGHWQAWTIWLTILLFPFFAAGARSGASLAATILVVLGLFYGRRAWQLLGRQEKQIFLGFALFFAAISLASLFGDEGRTVIRVIERHAALVFALPAYLAVRYFVREPGRPLVAGLLLAPIGALLFGIEWDFGQLLGVFTLDERPQGGYNTIVYSNITAVFLILLLAALILFARSWATLSGGMLLLLIGVVMVLASASRNAMLFLPVGVLLCVLLLYRQLDRRHLAILLAATLVVVAVLSLSPQSTALERLSMAYSTLFSDAKQDHSTAVRLQMWKDSLTIWKIHPVLGSGPGSFHETVRELQQAGVLASSYRYTHAHSIYLQALATSGLLGFVTMLWFCFARPLNYAWGAWRGAIDRWQLFYAVGLILLIVSYLIFGITESWFSRNPMFRTYLLGVVILMAGIASSMGASNEQD